MAHSPAGCDPAYAAGRRPTPKARDAWLAELEWSMTSTELGLAAAASRTVVAAEPRMMAELVGHRVTS